MISNPNQTPVHWRIQQIPEPNNQSGNQSATQAHNVHRNQRIWNKHQT
jgi:hypothetical protein